MFEHLLRKQLNGQSVDQIETSGTSTSCSFLSEGRLFEIIEMVVGNSFGYFAQSNFS